MFSACAKRGAERISGIINVSCSNGSYSRLPQGSLASLAHHPNLDLIVDRRRETHPIAEYSVESLFVGGRLLVQSNSVRCGRLRGEERVQKPEIDRG